MSNRTETIGASRGTAAPGGASRAGAYPLLVALVLVWGANWPIVKIGLHDISPFWLGATRLALGTLCLFALVALRGQLRLPQRRDLLMIADVGLLQMCAFMVLFNVALQYVDAGRAVIVAYTTPRAGRAPRFAPDSWLPFPNVSSAAPQCARPRCWVTISG